MPTPSPTKADLGVQTIDDCLRMVTAFDSFADLKDTQPTYAPKFYSRATTTAEAFAQRRRGARAFIDAPRAAA